MKSTTPINGQVTNGSSNTAEAGGFDALLVGVVLNGDRYDFGALTYFWSSSSAGGSYAWYRRLDCDQPGVRRSGSTRAAQFSVRCKKDQQ
jgi:uncharacterized protein (TIGR02145 family)